MVDFKKYKAGDPVSAGDETEERNAIVNILKSGGGSSFFSSGTGLVIRRDGSQVLELNFLDAITLDEDGCPFTQQWYTIGFVVAYFEKKEAADLLDPSFVP